MGLINAECDCIKKKSEICSLGSRIEGCHKTNLYQNYFLELTGIFKITFHIQLKEYI